MLKTVEELNFFSSVLMLLFIITTVAKVQPLLEVEFSLWLYGASLLGAFDYYPYIVLISLT